MVDQTKRPAPAIKPIEDRRMFAIGLMCLAMVGFTLVDTSAKWLVTAGFPTTEAVAVRYAVNFLVVLALFVPSHGKALFRTNNIKLEIIRALVLLVSTIANFIALQFLPLTFISAIVFTMPLFLCALSVPFLGEHVGWRRWAAIAVGFVGVLVVIRPGFDTFHPAIFLSFTAVICYAFYSIINRKLAGVDSAQTQQFYAMLIATAVILPFALPGFVWPQSPDQWLAFFAMGFAGAMAHMAITVAHRFAPATVLAPYVYVQIIFMTTSSWWVFGQPPDIYVFVGVAIVIASGLYIWLRERALVAEGKRDEVAARPSPPAV